MVEILQMTSGADEGVAGGAVPGDVPRLLPVTLP